MSDRHAPIFDGHNDILTRLLFLPPERRLDAFLDGDGKGHLDLPRMLEGGFCGGFFALFVPSPMKGRSLFEVMRTAPYDLPLPEPLSVEGATETVVTQAALLFEAERRSDGRLVVARDSAALRAAIESGSIGVVMHMEGAEPIDGSLERLQVWYAAGLRSLGPVWSRPNRFAHGVPMRFPGDPDSGDGLSDTGRRLVRECHRLGIVVDLSHLNARGFDDIARMNGAPLVATHSNVHALCPSSRNLTDRQLDAIRDSDGMVGINFATAFLREDGRMDANTPLETLLRHLDHLVERVGETRVGFGSDFDGAVIPGEIGSVTGLPALRDALARHGVDAALMVKLCRDNWLNLLERTIG